MRSGGLERALTKSKLYNDRFKRRAYWCHGSQSEAKSAQGVAPVKKPCSERQAITRRHVRGAVEQSQKSEDRITSMLPGSELVAWSNMHYKCENNQRICDKKDEGSEGGLK